VVLKQPARARRQRTCVMNVRWGGRHRRNEGLVAGKESEKETIVALTQDSADPYLSPTGHKTMRQFGT